MIRYVWFAIIMVLSGCSMQHHQIRQIQGAKLALEPRVHQWNFDTPSRDVSWMQVTRTLTSALDKLRIYPVSIYTTSHFLKRAKSIQDWLIGQGVPEQNITVHTGQYSGITVRYIIYQVQGDDCPRQRILYRPGEFQHSLSCTVEYMRWKSMVNPQRMVEKEDMQ